MEFIGKGCQGAKMTDEIEKQMLVVNNIFLWLVGFFPQGRPALKDDTINCI
jgi:hypothetical membrane protein